MADLLDIKSLKRNPDKIRKSLKQVGDSIVATEELRIIFPKRFVDKGLCQLDKLTSLIAYYCIADNDGNYAITTEPIIQTLSPDSIGLVNINNDNKDPYLVLKFYKDSVVIPQNDCVQDGGVLYDILQEFYINGKVPWYFNYEDLSNVMINSKKYTGTDIGSNPLAAEILTMLVSRNKNGGSYKSTLKDHADVYKSFPMYMGLSDIRSYQDTGARLIGSRLEDGITSALLNKETKTSDASDVLRA